MEVIYCSNKKHNFVFEKKRRTLEKFTPLNAKNSQQIFLAKKIISDPSNIVRISQNYFEHVHNYFYLTKNLAMFYRFCDIFTDIDEASFFFLFCGLVGELCDIVIDIPHRSFNFIHFCQLLK